MVSMKTVLSLGVLCLLFCLAWVQEKPVRTACTYYVFWVFVKKDLFGDGVLVRPQELTLGIGCPVTKELQDEFELQYLVRHCGIKKMVFETHTRFECSLYYRRHSRRVVRPGLEFPLTCIVYRKRSFQNSVVTAPILRPTLDQNNITKRIEHPPTYGKPDSYHLQGGNLLENLKQLQGTRGFLLTPHLISVVLLWKQSIGLILI
ncbi:oocyte-secreted protein 3-like [Notamacropus eugenii]|uniref:oocyte-secreted protein 3-like n=1 Tax=Notamacropus eugenii TaxID=9315 RepID=UPI003B679D36